MMVLLGTTCSFKNVMNISTTVPEILAIFQAIYILTNHLVVCSVKAAEVIHTVKHDSLPLPIYDMNKNQPGYSQS